MQNFVRIRQGKIVEHRGPGDTLAMLQQLGLAPNQNLQALPNERPVAGSHRLPGLPNSELTHKLLHIVIHGKAIDLSGIVELHLCAILQVNGIAVSWHRSLGRL